MSDLSMLGVGSGLPLNDFLNKLKMVENQKLKPLLRKQHRQDKQISSHGKFRAELDKLQTAAGSLMKFDKIVSTSVSKDHKTVAISNDEKAVPGNYEVTVEQLAQAQSLTTTAVDDVKKKLGGTVAAGQERILVIKQNSEKQPQEIKLTDEQTSLIEIRDAINKTDSNVSASLIKIKEGEHKLVLTAKKTGTDSAMDIEVKGDSTLNTFLGYQSSTAPAGGHSNIPMKQTIAAKNAKVTINKAEIERQSNEINDVLEGITFKLIKVSEIDTNIPGTGNAPTLKSETASISKDIEPIKKAIKNWVDAFNGLNSFYKAETKYFKAEPEDPSQPDGVLVSSNKNGGLLNDNTASMIMSQVKNLTLNVQNTPDINNLNHLGIGLDHEGKLIIDDKKLDAALKDNQLKVKQFFIGDGEKTGFATESFNYLKKTLDKLEGSLHLATETIVQQKKMNDNRIDEKKASSERMLKAKQLELARLDKAISKMTQSSSSLSSLASLAAR